MRKSILLVAAAALPVLVHGQAPAPTPAPATPPAEAAPLNLEQEMEQLYSDAASAFNLGKFDVALQKIAAIHTKTSNKDFEKVMFLEGACYYNLDQYDKAIEVLQKFVTAFPQSEVLAEAKMSLGRAYLKKKDEANGVKLLKEVALNPTLRDTAGLEIAYYFKNEKKIDEALDILQVILKSLQGAPTQEQQQAILMASEIYITKGDSDNASSMMEKLRVGATADESIVQLNNLSVKIGDAMMEQKRYREALLAYQNVRRQSELVRLQKARVTKVQEWQTQIAAGRRVFFMGRALTKEDAEALMQGNAAILEELEKAKDYDAAVYYRLGQCFYEMQRYYESILAFKKIYDEFRDFPDRSRCLFGMVICNAALNRSARAAELADRYMSEYPDGPNITQVTDMLGALLYQAGKVNEAIAIFRRALAAPGADKERLNFMLGSVLFEAQLFGESRVAFEEILANKGSAYQDDAQYRNALTYFFENNSQKARESLRGYVADNPKGTYLVDAKYRLAFIDFQGGDKAAARQQLEDLIKESPSDVNIGQVYSLLGDIYVQTPSDPKNNIDTAQLALDAYRSAVDKAKSRDVLDYSIGEATNLMVEKNLWPQISDMWSTYYQAEKGKPGALKAIYWITRARERQARDLEKEARETPDAAKKAEKLAEAQKVNQEARKLVAAEMIPQLGNPADEQVEVLMQQLVTMVVGKVKRRPTRAAVVDGGATPAASAQPEEKERTFEDMEKELQQLVTPEGDKSLVNGTAAARVLYGRALIARLLRDVPKFENLVSIIPDAAKPEELSPMLLAVLGEMLSKKGEKDKAAEFFSTLRKKYPTSEFADRAPVGLGQIELSKGDNQKALEYFNEAIDKYSATGALLDATLGKAQALYRMKKLDDAEKIYKTVFATREWRGAAHAESLYMQGLIMKDRNEFPNAISFFNRVIASQAKFKEWVAKAYLDSAQSAMQLNRKEDAVKVLRDMLNAKGMNEQPEFQKAQLLLNQISG